MPEDNGSQKITLLHVDDSEDCLLLMRARMSKLAKELEIVSAHDAGAALDALREREISCIICDYQMPDMDGMQLLRSLRDTGNTTPFIFLSSRDDDDVAKTALRTGADAYITKDIGVAMYQQILSAVQRTLHRLDGRESGVDVAPHQTAPLGA